MNINGTQTLHNLQPAQLWDGLLNPSLLIKVLPYAQNFTFLRPQGEAVLNLYGTFGQPEPQKVQAKITFTDHQRPHQYRFQFSLVAEDGTGAIHGQGMITLETAARNADTTVQYEITGEAEGSFAQTGDMLLETIGRGFMREVLTGMGTVLRQEELITPLPVTPPPPSSHIEPWLIATAVAVVPLIIAFIWRKRHRNAEE